MSRARSNAGYRPLPPVDGLAELAPLDTPPLIDITSGALLAARAAEYPDRVALVGESHLTGGLRRLTYRELHEEAQAVATGLLSLDADITRVGIWAVNYVEWVILEYAIALADKVLVAFNPAWTAYELRYAVEHSAIDILVHAASYRGAPVGDLVKEATEQTAANLIVTSLDVVGEWAERYRGVTRDTSLLPDDISMIQFTSGTTGTPKGVLIRHRAAANTSRFNMLVPGIQDGEVLLSSMPMFHTAGCISCTLGPLWIGGTLVLQLAYDPIAAVELIRNEGVTFIITVPTMLQGMIAAVRDEKVAPVRIPTVLVGAALVPSALIAQARATFDCRVGNVYGQTELAAPVIVTRPDDTDEDVSEFIGQPFPHAACKIVDPATQRTVPLEMTGELCIKGYQVMAGYLDDPDATAAALDSDGWLRTGDLAAMDERGMIRHTGRVKELIIRGGENIAPAEIESCLSLHHNVEAVVVLGLPDDRLGEIVVAALRLRKDDQDVRYSLVEHARGRLARYKVPANWYIVDELPATSSGKVKVFAVRDLILDGTLPVSFTTHSLATESGAS